MNKAKSRISRRAMLGGLAAGASGVGAAALAFGSKFAPVMSDSENSWWTSGAVPLETAAARDWAGKIGATFEVDGGEAGKASYKLTAVRPLESLGERPRDVARQRGFIAMFEGDRRLDGDRIYPVQHSQGSLDIYFSAAPDSSGPVLTAVFN